MPFHDRSGSEWPSKNWVWACWRDDGSKHRLLHALDITFANSEPESGRWTLDAYKDTGQTARHASDWVNRTMVGESRKVTTHAPAALRSQRHVGAEPWRGPDEMGVGTTPARTRVRIRGHRIRRRRSIRREPIAGCVSGDREPHNLRRNGPGRAG